MNKLREFTEFLKRNNVSEVRYSDMLVFLKNYFGVSPSKQKEYLAEMWKAGLVEQSESGWKIK